MKKYLSCLLFLLTLNIFASNFITFEKYSEIIRIQNNFYRVAMFPGHIFPVFWQSSDGKKEYEIKFADALTDTKTSTVYLLTLDRMAQRKIIKQNEKEFIIEMQGTFCSKPEKAFDENIKAVYRWHFTANSPLIQCTVNLKRKDTVTCSIELFAVSGNLVCKTEKINTVWTTNTYKGQTVLELKK